MKNKKTLLGLVLIVMVLVLGVGYAIVNSTNLTVTGTAGTETRNLDVIISAADPTSGAYYGTTNNSTSATITVTGMSTVNETKTVTYTVSNRESNLDATVYVESQSNIVVSKPSYFSATTSITGSGNAITVPANSTATFTVTVKLDAIPIESADSTTDITITIKADPAAPTP